MVLNWTKNENDILLDAIEQGINSQHVIEIVMSATSRTEESVLRKLKGVGYLRSCGRSFTSKQGFSKR